MTGVITTLLDVNMNTDHSRVQTELQPGTFAEGESHREHLDDGRAARTLSGADEGDHAIRVIADGVAR